MRDPGRLRRRWVFVLALGCAGCSLSFPPESPPGAAPATAPAAKETAVREALLETALGQIGRPYRYGGGDGDGFDCSGLARHVYAEAGIDLPRTAQQQRHAGREIRFADAQPGDLVFYRIGGGTHVGIYVGDGRAVHAPSAGKQVQVTDVTTAYWTERFVAAIQIVP